VLRRIARSARDLVVRLHRARAEQNAQLAVAASGGQSHPVIGLWSVALREELRHALVVEDIRKIDRWTARYPLATVTWPVEPLDPFFNANTMDDIAQAERLAALDGVNPSAVIPGCAAWRRPGIHTHDRGYGFRARSFYSRPGMTIARPYAANGTSRRRRHKPNRCRFFPSATYSRATSAERAPSGPFGSPQTGRNAFAPRPRPDAFQTTRKHAASSIAIAAPCAM